MPLERVEVSNVVSKSTTLEQREAILRTFLETHPCITRTDYSRLTHILKNKAISDLNQFVADGWLTKYGAGRTVVYLLVR